MPHYLIKAVLLLISTGLISNTFSQEDSLPNFVIVVVDDMRWDDFHAGGNSVIETPNIDRIAREGAYFLNAFTANPLCSPSRATLLTGQYASKHGIIDNTERGPISHGLNTFPRMLDDAGYQTAFVGKWHMGNDDSRRPGFDYWVSMKGQGVNIDPEIIEGDKRQVVKGHITDIFTDYAISFLKRERDRPFLLYLAHKALHPGIDALIEGGFTAAERHTGHYADAPIERRPNAGVTPYDKPALMRKHEGLPDPGSGTMTSDATIRGRMEMMLGVDESTGRLLETLTEIGELENTVFIFTSDHGYFYGEHGLNPERRLAYEESIRIPFLIRYPQMITPETKVEELTLTVDLAPTVLELAGLEQNNKLHGLSLLPLLTDQTTAGWRTSIMIEHHTEPNEYLERGGGGFLRVRNMGYQAVRNERYKYIRYTDLDGMDELYDLYTDPYELNNLIHATGSQVVLGDMKAELDRLLQDLD